MDEFPDIDGARVEKTMKAIEKWIHKGKSPLRLKSTRRKTKGPFEQIAKKAGLLKSK